MTRLTDAELAEMEARAGAAGGFALYRVSESYAADVPRLLAELKAERERCAEFEELAIQRWAWLIQHGIDPDTGKEKFRKPCLRCDSFAHHAKALKETE